MDQFAVTLTGQPVAIAALEAGQEISEIEIVPTTPFKLGDGRGSFTMPDPAAFIEASLAYASRHTGGELLVDFDHGAERKGVDDKRTAAAGWITGLRHDTARGRVMATVRWTRAGREALADRAYRFISPVFAHDKQNRVRGIVRAGLTNTPAIGELAALAASTQGDGSMEELLKKLAAALGLDAEAGEDKITAAALELISTGKNAEVVIAAAGIEGGLSPEAAEKLAGEITAAASAGADPDPAKFVPKEAFDELSTEVASLKAAAATGRADDLVASASAAGKLVPASMSWAKAYAAKDPDGFADWVKTAPVVCASGELLPQLRPAAEGGLTEMERQVCASTGVSEEAFIATRDGKKPAKKEA